MALLQTSLRQLPTPPRVLEAVPRAVEEEREKMQMSLDRLAMQDDVSHDGSPQKQSSGRSRKKRDRALHAFAKAAKVSGDAALVKGAFADAVGHYTTGLEAGCVVLSNAKLGVFYSNRSAAFAGLGRFDLACDDADVCLTLRPDWPNGWMRKGIALRGMSDDIALRAGSDAPEVAYLRRHAEESFEKVGELERVSAERPDKGLLGMLGTWVDSWSQQATVVEAMPASKAPREHRSPHMARQHTATSSENDSEKLKHDQEEDKIDASLDEAARRSRINITSTAWASLSQPPTPNTPSSTTGSPGSTLSWGKPVGRWRMEAEEASRQIDQGSRQNQRHSAAPSISDHINARRSQASPGCTAGLPDNGQNQMRPRGIIKPNSPATISGIPVHFQYSHRRANDGRGNPGKPGGPRSNREVREVNREFLQSYAEKKRVKFDMEDQVLFIQGRGDLEEEAREDQPNQRSSVLSFRRAASGLFSSIRSVDVTSKSSVNLARELRPCSPQT